MFLNLLNIYALGALTLQTLVISTSYSAAEAGVFSLAMSMTNLPIMLVSMATAPVVHHKFIDIYEKNPKKLTKIVLQLLFGFVIIGVLPYASIYSFGQVIFETVFGSEWRQSGAIASLFAFPLFLQFLLTPLSTIFRVTKTIKHQFMLDQFFILITMGLFYFSSKMLDFMTALTVLVAVLSCHCSVKLVFCVWIAWKKSVDGAGLPAG